MDQRGVFFLFSKLFQFKKKKKKLCAFICIALSTRIDRVFVVLNFFIKHTAYISAQCLCNIPFFFPFRREIIKTISFKPYTYQSRKFSSWTMMCHDKKLMNENRDRVWLITRAVKSSWITIDNCDSSDPCRALFDNSLRREDTATREGNSRGRKYSQNRWWRSEWVEGSSSCGGPSAV